MSCGIRRIVNGCAAHQVVAHRDVSEPGTHPPSSKSPAKGSARSRVHARAKLWISVLGWTWRDGSKGSTVNGLSGVASMVYFHFFTAAPSSQLSWLGATLFITGIFVLFDSVPGLTSPVLVMTQRPNISSGMESWIMVPGAGYSSYLRLFRQLW
jgi:hypothetical protein